MSNDRVGRAVEVMAAADEGGVLGQHVYEYLAAALDAAGLFDPAPDGVASLERDEHARHDGYHIGNHGHYAAACELCRPKTQEAPPAPVGGERRSFGRWL